MAHGSKTLSKKRIKIEKFPYPIAMFRDEVGHTVDIDLNDKANLRSKEEPSKRDTLSNGRPGYKYLFDGGPIGPEALAITVDAGWVRYDFANLVYHAADNPDLEGYVADVNALENVAPDDIDMSGEYEPFIGEHED